MNYHVECYTNEHNGLAGIQKFVNESDIDEVVCWQHVKYYILAKDNDAIIGVVLYSDALINNDVYPRFLHVIISPKYRRTKSGLKLMRDSEKYFAQQGKKQIIAYIINDLPNRDMKKRYAIKFGYRKYSETPNGEYFYKNLFN